MTEITRLQRRLLQIENELEKVRGCSPLTDGWQTQQFARKSRKWDMLAQEKFNLQRQIEDLKAGTDIRSPLEYNHLT